ncbi:MAG: proteasome subunit beta [Candidatus Nanoarchaeia archaeon]|nr:proteasome subunit beta [Candidatus Nanoarchaeia archaeon]
MENENIMKTGTTTLGIICKDGIILAADRRATAGNMIVDKKAQKVYKINDRMALTTAGGVSDIQLLVKLLKAELALKSVRTEREPNVTEAVNLLAGMVYSNIRKMSMIPGISHFLFGGIDSEGTHLYDIYPDGSLSKNDEFISSGSGSVMAYGVLETLYRKDMKIEEGAKLAVKCLNAALQRDSASGNGVDIISITDEGVKNILEKEINNKIE